MKKRLEEKKAALAALEASKETSKTPPPNAPPSGRPKKKGGVILSDEERQAMMAATKNAPKFGGGRPAASSSPFGSPAPPPVSVRPKKKGGLMLSDEERQAMMAATLNAPKFGGGGGGGVGDGGGGNKNEEKDAAIAAKNRLRFATAPRPTASPALTPPQTNVNDEGDVNGGYGSDDSATPFDGDMANVKSLTGQCQFMCPPEEIAKRERENEIKKLERIHPDIYPANFTLRDTVIKRFVRSSAGLKFQIPSLVRPPAVLETTMSFLEEYIMDRDRQGHDPRFDGVPDPLDTYVFVWERTRMIRKDIVLQNYTGGSYGKNDASVVRTHERIARWHALIHHQLYHLDDYAIKQSSQNTEQLGKTLKSLNDFYDDPQGRANIDVDSPPAANRHGVKSPITHGPAITDYDGSPLDNTTSAASTRCIGSTSIGTDEASMRCLFILFMLNKDMEVIKFAARLSPAIFNSEPVQFALEVYLANKSGNYAKFFSLLKSASYLNACVMFNYVKDVRKTALRIMSKTMGNKAGADAYPLRLLENVLAFESSEECRNTCLHYGLTVEDAVGDESSPPEPCVLWKRTEFNPSPAKELRPLKMVRWIESKHNNSTRLHLCRGGGPNPMSKEDMERMRLEREAREKEEAHLALQREALRREQAEALRLKKLEEERLNAGERARAEQERARLETERRRQQELLDKERTEKERKEAQERAAREKLAREEEERRRQEAQKLAEQERLRQEEAARQEAEKRRAEDQRLEELRRVEAEKKRVEEQRRQELAKLERERLEREEVARKLAEEAAKRQREMEERQERERFEREVKRAKMTYFLRKWRKATAEREKKRAYMKSFDLLDVRNIGKPPASEPFAAVREEEEAGFSDSAQRNALQKEIDSIHLGFMQQFADTPSDSAISYGDVWCSDGSYEPANPVPVLFKLGVVFPSKPSLNTAADYLDASRKFVMGRLGKEWSGRSDINNERIEVRVVEIKTQSDAQNVAGVLFVAASGSPDFSANQIKWVSDKPRILYCLLGEDDQHGCNVADVVGEENVDNSGAVVRIANLSNDVEMEEKLAGCVRGLIAGRMPGLDVRLIQISRAALVRKIIREILFWNELAVEGEMLVNSVIKGLQAAAKILREEKNADEKTLKHWPDKAFSHNNTIAGYFGFVGGNLPVPWKDRNKVQLDRWKELPLLRHGKFGGGDLIIQMIQKIAKEKKSNASCVAAAIVNADDMLRMGIWRRAIDSMLLFWEEGGKNTFAEVEASKDFMYLRKDTIERCLAEMKIDVLKSAKASRVRSGNMKEGGWERTEFVSYGYLQMEEEGDKEEDWDDWVYGEEEEATQENMGELMEELDPVVTAEEPSSSSASSSSLVVDKVTESRVREREEDAEAADEERERQRKRFPRTPLESIVLKEKEDSTEWSERLRKMLEG
jgi:hypothetical protein